MGGAAAGRGLWPDRTRGSPRLAGTLGREMSAWLVRNRDRASKSCAKIVHHLYYSFLSSLRTLGSS